MTKGNIMDNNRKTAFKILVDIEENDAYSNIAVNRLIAAEKPESPSLVRSIVYGTLENRLLLDHIIAQNIRTSLSKVKIKPRVILRMGLYQLLMMDSVPDYAAINESVNLANKFTRGQSGFVNGVLRGFCRKDKSYSLSDKEEDPVTYLSVRYSIEPGIAELFINERGIEAAEEILRVSNTVPPLFIRPNRLKTDADMLCADLAGQGYEVRKLEICDQIEHNGYTIDDGHTFLSVKGEGIFETDEFKKGMFSVQDISSAEAVRALDPVPGQTVIDVCAAPGGKTCYIAELMGNTGKIHAFDIFAHKIDLINDTAERLDISIVDAQIHDSTVPESSLIGTADRVICDAPCSGLGVLRRKPEIKYRGIRHVVNELVPLQRAILDASFEYLKPGGRLVYSTCTISRRENEDIVDDFILRSGGTAVLISTKQRLPSVGGGDGFFHAVIEKQNVK